MTENSSEIVPIHSAEIRDLIKRLYTLRNRFRAILPENLTSLMEQAKLEGKREGVSSINQYYFMGILLYRQTEPITMGDLSRLLDVPFSTATHCVDWFVKNNFARRLADPDDRRVVRVELTDSGKQIMELVNEFIYQRILRIMDSFTDDEQGQMIYLLRKFVTLVEQEV
jgi:DNA-binding MarR family transcriptional regulator